MTKLRTLIDAGVLTETGLATAKAMGLELVARDIKAHRERQKDYRRRSGK